MRVFEDDFLLGILGPALLQPAEAELITSTRYVSHIIEHIEPPLLHLMLSTLFPVDISFLSLCYLSCSPPSLDNPSLTITNASQSRLGERA